MLRLRDFFDEFRNHESFPIQDRLRETGFGERSTHESAYAHKSARSTAPVLPPIPTFPVSSTENAIIAVSARFLA
jgi:hypothetical protein